VDLAQVVGEGFHGDLNEKGTGTGPHCEVATNEKGEEADSQTRTVTARRAGGFSYGGTFKPSVGFSYGGGFKFGGFSYGQG
jgi:hypothetical protein